MRKFLPVAVMLAAIAACAALLFVPLPGCNTPPIAHRIWDQVEHELWLGNPDNARPVAPDQLKPARPDPFKHNSPR